MPPPLLPADRPFDPIVAVHDDDATGLEAPTNLVCRLEVAGLPCQDPLTKEVLHPLPPERMMGQRIFTSHELHKETPAT